MSDSSQTIKQNSSNPSDLLGEGSRDSSKTNIASKDSLDSSSIVLEEKPKTFMTTLLESFDFFGVPIRFYSRKGQTQEKSNYGGCLSIITYLLLAFALVSKIVSIDTEILMQNDLIAQRALRINDDRRNLQALPEKNFKWTEDQNIQFNSSQYQTAFALNQFGIQKVELIMNDRELRVEEDNQAFLLQSLLKDIKREDVTYDPKRNSTRVKELQSYFKYPDGPLRFIRFTIEKFNFRGDKESTIIEEVDLNGDGTAETTKSVTVKSTYDKKDFKVYDQSKTLDNQDFDWKTDPLMPRFDFTKYVEVLGDEHSSNFTEFKTTTRLSMRVAYEEMEIEAQENAVKYFRDFGNGIGPGDGSFSQYECEDAKKKREDLTALNDNDGLRAAQAVENAQLLLEGKSDQIVPFQDWLVEQQENQMKSQLQVWNNNWKGSFGLEYFKQRVVQEKIIRNNVLDTVAVIGIPKLDYMSDENKIITKSQITDFKYWLGQCFDLVPNGREYNKVNYKFEQKYVELLLKYKNELVNAIDIEHLGDAFMINVQEDGISEAQTVLQSDSYTENTQCFSKNVDDASDGQLACRKRTNSIYFKLNQHQSQDILRSPGIVGSASGDQLEIKPAVNKEQKLEYSRTIDFKKIQVQQRPNFADAPTMNFESFYEVNFSLEPVVKIKKAIWMVQDKDSPRKLSELDEEEARNTISKRQYFMYFIDICAYMGAIWFVITKMIIGPIMDLIHQPMYVAEISSGTIKCQSSNTNIKPQEIEMS